jgi:serine/threonine-protein kinase
LKVRDCEPVDPRTRNARVDADLAAICLKCLEKDPARRYDAPRSLAEDLENWLEGKSIQARPVGRVVRLLRWCRRKPALAGVIVLASLFLVFATSTGFMVAASRSARRKVILENNVFMAQGVANQVQLKLQDYSRPVLEAAERPELAELFLRRDPPGLAGFLDRMRSATPTPSFESWLIVDPTGVMIARSPSNTAVGTNVDVRDYSRGTKAHVAAGGERGLHISRVYQSLANKVFMYAICVPILGPKRELLGVLAASLSTGDTLGLPNLLDARCKATLVGPFDPGRLPEDPPIRVPEWVILVQEGMSRRDPAIEVVDPMLKAVGVRSCPKELSNPAVAGLSARKAATIDPYQKRDATYSGTWLSGYAPVGNTGFVVIIQQKEE